MREGMRGHPPKEAVSPESQTADVVGNETRENKTMLLKQLDSLLPEMERQFGPVGIGLLGRLATREITLEDFETELGKTPDFEEFQKKPWNIWKKSGWLKKLTVRLLLT